MLSFSKTKLLTLKKLTQTHGGSVGRAVGDQVRGPSFESQSGPSQLFIAPLCPPSTKWDNSKDKWHGVTTPVELLNNNRSRRLESNFGLINLLSSSSVQTSVCWKLERRRAEITGGSDVIVE
ncbi:hypothetical protein PoB_003748000 [Plakobranchus ocellatus]|uniref:Uncharacterized protein n=1 Tax=Plakobranchus ocellatus TaxID=259542 RepID=A0AAV4ARQ9_9GAST|nr:hypothetical protein PoB_003748000 [Plakobranchus ocellatus]